MLMLEEAMSQKRSTSGSSNVMKRLMLMRKIKQDSEGLYDDNTVETLNDECEMINPTRFVNQQRVQSPPYRDLSNGRNQRQKIRKEDLAFSGTRRDCSSLCSNEKSASKNPLNRISIHNQQFVSRWNKKQEFQKSITEAAVVGIDKDIPTKIFSNKTFTYFDILPDTQKDGSNERQFFNYEDESEQENFFYPQDENIYNELDTKSIISSGSMLNKFYAINSANAARKLQSNRIIDNLNAIQMVPNVNGITKQQMLDLFNAKCHDLKITSSRNQMIRFFDTFVRNQGLKERRLNLSDSGIGDHSMKVVCQILKNNQCFAQVKNSITNTGIKLLAQILKKNNTIVHLDVGCNQFSNEGAFSLFQSLLNNESVTSLNLGNSDCYKNKNKIGVKSAMALGELIATNHFIQFVDLSDSNLSQESLSHLIYGVKQNPNLVSLNLSHNDLGVGTSPYTPFNHLLTVFDSSKSFLDSVSCQSLEELVLSDTNLNNKLLDELAHVIKKCAKTKIARLDISQNGKVSTKGALSLLTALRANLQIKITHLNLDKANLSMGIQQEQITNFFELIRILAEYLRASKSLKSLSLNGCQVSDDLMNGIGKGLAVNENLEQLSLKSNQISLIGLRDLLAALTDNKDLKLNYIDLSSNNLNDEAGQQLANGLTKLNYLEQLFLRDNELGVEAGDSLFFLAQQKKTLWKIQLEKNSIRYGTLVEIEKECKKNKKNFYQGKQGHYQGIRQEISELAHQSQQHPESYQVYHALASQINTQQQIIRQGQEYIHRQEEKVNILRTNDQQLSIELEAQLSQLIQHLADLDAESAQLTLDTASKEKEWQRKLEFERGLLDRQREYVARELGRRVEEERKKVAVKRAHRRVDEEAQKLTMALEKANRDAQLMAMIADNYQKEINRRKIQNSTTEGTGDGQRGNVQSANMVLFYNKKSYQMAGLINGDEKNEKVQTAIIDGADENKLRKSKDGRKTPKLPAKKNRKLRSNERTTNNNTSGNGSKSTKSTVKMIANLKEGQCINETQQEYM